jgi:hypothetical protein
MTNLSPAVRLKQGRTKLLLDFPFFGVLILRLKDVETPSIDTMATDGVSLFYNPEFVTKLTPPELLGCLAHEVMHPALQHHTRRGTRSAKRWNVACDFAINPLIRDANLTLPAGALYDPAFRNLSAERIYNLIAEDKDGDSAGGHGNGSPEFRVRRSFDPGRREGNFSAQGSGDRRRFWPGHRCAQSRQGRSAGDQRPDREATDELDWSC